MIYSLQELYSLCEQKSYIIDGKAYRRQNTYIYFIRHNFHTYNPKTNNTKLSEYNFIIRIIHKNIICKKHFVILNNYMAYIVNQYKTLNAASNVIKDRPIFSMPIHFRLE